MIIGLISTSMLQHKSASLEIVKARSGRERERGKEKKKKVLERERGKEEEERWT